MRHVILICLLVSLLTPPATAGAGHVTSSPAQERSPRVDAFLHLTGPTARSAVEAAVEDAGGSVLWRFTAIDALWVAAQAPVLEALGRLGGVADVEPAGTEPLLMDTAAHITNVRQLRERGGGPDLRIATPGGDTIDGRGVGIAVVDTGIDTTHPALEHAAYGLGAPKVAGNYLVVCSVDPVLAISEECMGPAAVEEGVATDDNGHGTHVAGIAAGQAPNRSAAGETAPSHSFTGVATGATLYGFSTNAGNLVRIGAAAATFDWIHAHGHELDPPIKVVNNSWGAGGDFDPDTVLARLTTALVQDRGITVTWAAGNHDSLSLGANDGTEDQVTRHAKNPVPGVIAVAAYADGRSTSRERTAAAFSSRGLATDPSTWPDISAPGDYITAPCAATDPRCGVTVEGGNLYAPRYAAFSGTSMATPHISGIAALLYQLDPAITPAEVEHLLEATAHKYGALYAAPYQPDPAHPGTTSSFDRGHGLVDARAAVIALLDDDEIVPGPSMPLELSDPTDPDIPAEADLLSARIDEVADGLRFSWTTREESRSDFELRFSSPAGETWIVVLRGNELLGSYGGEEIEPVRLEQDGETISAVFDLDDLRASPGDVIVGPRIVAALGPLQVPVDAVPGTRGPHDTAISGWGSAYTITGS